MINVLQRKKVISHSGGFLFYPKDKDVEITLLKPDYDPFNPKKKSKRKKGVPRKATSKSHCQIKGSSRLRPSPPRNRRAEKK